MPLDSGGGSVTASQSTVRGLRGVLLLGVLFCSPSTGAAEEGGDTPTAHEDKGGAATVADEKPPVGAGAPEGAYHAPSLLQESLPEYPPELREQAVRGDVLLQLDLDETGKPFRISVVETDHPGFSDAAVRAAKKLLFEPARIGAEPVPSRLRYRYQFEPGLGEDGKRRVRHLMAEEGRGETAVVHDSIQVLAERPYRVFRPLREAPPDRPETGTFVLGKRDIELAAGAVSDVAMAVQQLPSVSRQSFFRGSYSVRGSADADAVG